MPPSKVNHRVNEGAIFSLVLFFFNSLAHTVTDSGHTESAATLTARMKGSGWDQEGMIRTRIPRRRVACSSRRFPPVRQRSAAWLAARVVLARPRPGLDLQGLLRGRLRGRVPGGGRVWVRVWVGFGSGPGLDLPAHARSEQCVTTCSG